jgi:hypothetical protein
MTQYLYLQRKARECDCSLVRNPQAGKKAQYLDGKYHIAKPYWFTFRNGRTIPVDNLKDVVALLIKENYDKFWEDNLRDKSKYPKAKMARRI